MPAVTNQVTDILYLILGMVVITLVLNVGNQNKFKRFLSWIVFLVYLGGNFYFTLFSREPGTIAQIEKELLHNYKKALAFDGGVVETVCQVFTEGLPALEGIRIQSFASAREIILNILLYIPMGYLLPLLFVKWKYRRIVMMGFMISLYTENTQLVFRLGEYSSSDLMNNTLGTVVGLIVYMLIFQLILRKRRNRS